MRIPKFPRRVRYPVWSVKTITATTLFVVGVTAAPVFLAGKRSIFVETELTLAILAAALFAFLAVGLYRGVRVRRKDLPGTDVKGFGAENMDFSFDNLGSLPDGLDGGDEGCLAVVGALLLAAIAGLLLVLVLWVLINLGIVVWVFLLAATAYVFYLALRQVFAKSRVCRGNLPASLGYALWYTILYTGWLFVVVWVAGWVIGPRLRGGA